MPDTAGIAVAEGAADTAAADSPAADSPASDKAAGKAVGNLAAAADKAAAGAGRVERTVSAETEAARAATWE